MTILILIACYVGGVASLLSVVFGYSSPWLLLLAALLLWSAGIGSRNLYDWFSRTPIGSLSLTQTGFVISQEEIAFDQVLLINCNAAITQKRQNFVKAGRDFTVTAEITDRTGRVFKLRAGQGPVTWFGPTYGADESRRLLTMLRAGHAHTTALWTSEQ